MIRPQMILAVAIALVGAACTFDLSGPAGPGPDRRVPELHGASVAAANPMADLVWSPSGDEVTFVSPDFRTAYAYSPTQGTSRQLYVTDQPDEQIYHVALSADGAEWFTAAHSFTGSLLRRHSAAGSVLLTDHGGYSGLGVAHASPLLVAPGQPLIAFVAGPDSLFLLRHDSEAVFLATGCASLVTFSPDGSRVLCQVGYPASLVAFNTGDGAPEPLQLPERVESFARLVRWDSTGIRIVYWDGSTGLRLYEHGSGSTRQLAPNPTYPESATFWHASWSADGRTIAYWSGYCAQASGLFDCAINQAFLYVVDVATGKATRIAVHTLADTDYGLQLAVSPNGNTVAYVAGGQLYVLSVR